MKNIIINILKDLRKSLIISLVYFCVIFVIVYLYKENVYLYITKPVKRLLQEQHLSFIYTNLWETFLTDISICAWSALFLSIPVFLASLYLFISPSLYKKEKSLFIIISFCSVLLFIISFLLLYYFIFPQAISFFATQNTFSAIPMLKISEYITTFFHMVFGFGVVFQMPIFIFLLAKIGLIKKQTLSKNRKYAVVFFLSLSAIITPPDVLSQVICTIVLMIIYEIVNFIIQKTCVKDKKNKIKKNKSDAVKQKSSNNKHYNKQRRVYKKKLRPYEYDFKNGFPKKY